MPTPPADERRLSQLAKIRFVVLVAIGWLALVLACVLIVPGLIHPQLSASTLKNLGENEKLQRQQEQRSLQNEVRTTLVQGSVGLLALAGASAGAYVAWQQLQETRRHQQRSEELTGEGQVTERFTRAVEQLGSDKLDVRLGGIYALERIAKDSQPDRAAIAEIMSAYVRERTPWPPSRSG